MRSGEIEPVEKTWPGQRSQRKLSVVGIPAQMLALLALAAEVEIAREAKHLVAVLFAQMLPHQVEHSEWEGRGEALRLRLHGAFLTGRKEWRKNLPENSTR